MPVPIRIERASMHNRRKLNGGKVATLNILTQINFSRLWKRLLQKISPMKC